MPLLVMEQVRLSVPAHDQRDWEFAKQFDLPIVEVHLKVEMSEAAYTQRSLCMSIQTS